LLPIRNKKMIKSSKINIALLILCAFVFRLLFVNISNISSLNTQHTNSIVKHHFSIKMKRRKHIEASQDNTKNRDYSITTEVYEEDSDDDDNEIKSNAFVLVESLSPLASSQTENKLSNFTSLSKHFSYSSSPRYLTFQAFRI
jgi:hypothetical protein